MTAALPLHSSRTFSPIAKDDVVAVEIEFAAGCAFIEEPVGVIDLQYRTSGVSLKDVPTSDPLTIVGLHQQRDGQRPAGENGRGAFAFSTSRMKQTLRMNQIGKSAVVSS